MKKKFPEDLARLKQQIVDSKKSTEKYEENTKILAEELKVLKERANNAARTNK